MGWIEGMDGQMGGTDGIDRMDGQSTQYTAQSTLYNVHISQYTVHNTMAKHLLHESDRIQNVLQ
jgi:hypothetical protein